MKVMKRFFAVIVCALIISSIALPIQAAETSKHYYSVLEYNTNPMVAAAKRTYTYSEGMEKASMTVKGNDVTFYIPAVDDFPTLEIYGTWDESIADNDVVVRSRFASSYGTIRGAYSINDYYSDDSNNRLSDGRIARYFYFVRHSSGDLTVEIRLNGRVANSEYDYDHLIVLSGIMQNGTIQEQNSRANIDPGEDDGTVIWNDIVEGFKTIPGVDDISDPDTAEKVAVSLGGALVAGAVTLGGRKRKKNGGEDDEEKKRKTYKMKIYKNFGDGIHRGSKPVPVWARIVEVVDGHEKNRPDLSERITASGEGLTVSLAGVQNTYQTAMISVPPDSALEKAVLVFTFSGEGGVFCNRISFRVLGEPRIVFPRMTEDGTGWIVNAELDTVRMVAGMGGRDRLRFVIADAGEEPEDITFGEAEGFKVRYVKDAELAFTYWAEITNQTPLMQKENGIFAEPENRDIPIRATFADGSVVENALRVELWPDGISIPAKDAKDGVLQVDTRPDELAGEGYSEIKPAGFEVYVCYTDTDGTAVILENPTLTFGKPDDGGKYGLTIRENFLYDISRPGSAGFLIFPKVTLPLLGEPYEAVIPVSYNGNNIQPANLPLRLLGEMPEENPGKAELALEMSRLKKDIEFFGLDGDPALLGMVRAANRGECSAEDIRNIRYRLLEAATAFYEKERDAHMQMADLFSKYIVVAGALQTAGDYALEYVMNTYWPGYGRVTAKFINPFKNILFTYLGEQINIMAAITTEYSDGSIPAQQIDFVEVVLKSTEEAMASAIGFLIVPDDVTGAVEMMRKAKAMEDFQNAAGYIVAAYLLTSYIEHYYGYNGKGKKGEKGDVYRSVLAAFADLGYESLKAWVLDYIQKYGKKLFEMIGKCCGEVFKKVFKTQINAAALKAGQKAYGDSIKGKFTELGPGYSDLSRDAFKNAIRARNAASASVHTQVDSAFESFSAWLASDGYDMQEFVLGRTINYFFGGTGEDGTGSIGGDTRDVLYESFTKWLGVKVGDVYEGGGLLNPYDVTYRIEDGKIKIGIFGYIAEISILENIMAFGELLFEGLFSWMDTLWEAGKTMIDTENVPDPRVRIIKSTVEISNQLKRQVQRAGTLEWQFTEYKKKTEKGDETII